MICKSRRGLRLRRASSKREVVVRAVLAGGEQQRETLGVEVELLEEGRALLGGQRRTVKARVEQEAAHGRAAGRHAEAARHGSGFGHGADEKIGLRVDPVAAEAVLAEQLAAVGDAAYVVASEVGAGEFKEAVVERAVRGKNHARADVVEDGAEAVRAQEPVARVVQPGDLQEIEINVVRPRRVALDAVVEADAELVERVGVFPDTCGSGSRWRRRGRKLPASSGRRSWRACCARRRCSMSG